MQETTQLNTRQTSPTGQSFHLRELTRRMSGPQRYRLLQGYPMPPLMKEAPPALTPRAFDTDRKLIVGILPHASCAPSVKGCGYCTFPHEQFHRSHVEHTVNTVISELRSTPHRGRRVEALYFGGGTANLTPAKSFAELQNTASSVFDLSQAEVTLEGAPAFFLSQDRALLNLLSDHLQCRSKRLSMGVQTFNLPLLEKMGRLSMGHPDQVSRAVEEAHARGMTCSADLMINLPGQTPSQMLEDVERASALGFDQICIYHLVLFRGLGTPWSKNRDVLRSIPENQTAFRNWRKVTRRARQLGYVQKTVTNFERSGNYCYENDSFQPQSYDAAGFGPAAISCFTDLNTLTAEKWINPTANSSYRSNPRPERLFVYGLIDLKLLYLTRTLATLRADRKAYRRSYGSDPVADFPAQIEACVEAGLVQVSPTHLQLTERGNFFADSVTGLLARERVGEIRSSYDDPNSSGKIHMG